MLDILAKVTTTVLLWCVVLVGCGVVTIALADLYMLATGSKPGTPIFLDELAPMSQRALLQLTYGGALVIIPFLLRAAVKRWAK
jgi:hypothetical protein